MDKSGDADDKSGSADDSKSNTAVDSDDVEDDSADDEDPEDEDKATAKFGTFSKDNKDDSDRSFCPVNSNVDGSCNGDTEDEDQTSSSRKKKRNGGKKIPAEEIVQEALVAATKKKKQVMVTLPLSKPELRMTRQRQPISCLMLLSAKKFKACKPTMECLQHMSLLMTRSNEHEPPEDSDDESQSLVDQQGWPWMIHCLSC